jgi:hypothetical protein
MSFSSNLEKFYTPILYVAILLVGFFLNVYPRLVSAAHVLTTGSIAYFSSVAQGFWLLLVFIGMIIFLVGAINSHNKAYLLKPLYSAALISCVISVLGIYAFDLLWMYAVLSIDDSHTLSSIPVLLTEDRPIFSLDIKGELWATAARYRHEAFGRTQIAIDPFGVTRSHDFAIGKPK